MIPRRRGLVLSIEPAAKPAEAQALDRGGAFLDPDHGGARTYHTHLDYAGMPLSSSSPARWAEICIKLDCLSGEALTLALETAAEEVCHWPDTLRVAPVRWCRDVLDGREQPRLALARHLKLSLDQWPTSPLRTLLRHAALQRVSEVTLGNLRHREMDWVAALLPLASRLRALTLEGFQLNHLHLRRLFAGRAAWPLLERLVLTSNPLDLACVEVLAGSPLPQSLRVLGLGRSSLKGVLLESLLGVPWPALQSLDLSNNHLGDDVVSVLEGASLASLRRLNLSQAGLTEPGWRRLLKTDLHAQLEDLMGQARHVVSDTLSDGLPALRLALYHGTSAETWAEICEVVDRWPASQDWEMGRVYAEDHLSSWPDALRKVPMRWQTHFAQEQTLPRGWDLARSLAVQAWVGIPEPLTRLLKPEGLAHLHRLDLERAEVDETVLERLVEVAPDSLRHLGLLRCECKGIKNLGRTLGEASWWHKLQSLSLTGRHRLLSTQSGSWRLPSDLEVFDLEGSLCGEFPLVCLFEGPLPRGLHTLGLAETSLGPRSVAALSKSPVLQTLRALDVSRNKLPAEAWRSLMNSLFWPTLEELTLRRCTLSQSLEVLHDAPVSALRTLTLSNNRLGERGLGLVTDLRCFPHLTSLHLEACGLGGRAGQLLSYAAWSSSLRVLDLRNNNLGVAGVETLAQAPWPGLKHLDLSGNALKRTGLARLTLAPWWRQLSSLHLDSNEFDGTCVPLLQSLCEAEHLETLSLGGNLLNLKEIQLLRDFLPQVDVRV